MEYERIKEVNSRINKVDIKGKMYSLVNDRVLAFRELYPDGVIESDILSMNNGVVVIKATIRDGDKVIATGLAYEKEGSTYINKTSYIENCETSAVGRALGFLGIGADESICSAEELVNAVTNQAVTPEEYGERAISRPTEKQKKFLNNLWGKATEDEKAVIRSKYPDFDNITMAQATEIIGMLKK